MVEIFDEFAGRKVTGASELALDALGVAADLQLTGLQESISLTANDLELLLELIDEELLGRLSTYGNPSEQCPKVGDGVIGWHIMAVLTRRDSRREKDMPHERRYDFAVH